MKITDYTTVEETHRRPFLIEVRRLIADGWEPCGSAVIRYDHAGNCQGYSVSMVKREELPCSIS